MDRNPRLSVCEFPFNANWMFSIFRKWVKLHHHLPHTTSRGTARFLIRTSSCSPVVIMSFASPVSKNTSAGQPELSSKMFQNSTGSANSQPNGRSSFIMFYPENLSGYLPYTQPSGGQPCLSHLQARWHRWSRPAAGSTQRRACACSCLKLPIDTPWIGSFLGERYPKAQVRLMNSRDKDGSGIHPIFAHVHLHESDWISIKLKRHWAFQEVVQLLEVIVIAQDLLNDMDPAETAKSTAVEENLQKRAKDTSPKSWKEFKRKLR